MIRTYTATLIIPVGSTAGTVQVGNTYDQATGLTTSGVPVNGELIAIQLAFNANPMAGGTATLSTAGQGGPVQTLLNYIGGTSNWFYPHPQAQTTAGVAISGWYDRFPVDDNVNFVVTGGTAGTVTARMLLKQ